jgi:hypothetical protein
MSDELENAIQVLTTSFSDLRMVARGLRVNPEEVAEELVKATPDTAEFVVLNILHELNPI